MCVTFTVGELMFANAHQNATSLAVLTDTVSSSNNPLGGYQRPSTVLLLVARGHYSYLQDETKQSFIGLIDIWIKKYQNQKQFFLEPAH